MVPQNNASVFLITGREVSGDQRRETAQRHLVRVELSFLAESRRHVLGLDLLLGHVALVLAEKMLVLDLLGRQKNKLMNLKKWVYAAAGSPAGDLRAELTWLDFTKDLGPMSN